MKNEEYLTTPAHKLPKDKRSFNEFIYTEVFKQNDILLPDFLYKVSCLWKTEKFNSFLKYIQTVEDLEYKNDNFKFVSAFYRKCLFNCAVCGKESLTKYCSPKCSNSDPEVKRKKSETTMKHFGVSNPGQSEEIKAKMEESCLKHFGVKHSFQAESVKTKIRETSLRKYGVEHPMQSGIVKEHQKESIRERLGVDYPMQSKEVLEKSKNTCSEKYGEENVAKSDYFKEKLFKINFNKHHKNIQDFNLKFIRENFVEDCKFKIQEFKDYFGINSRETVNRFKKRLGILEQNNDSYIDQGFSKEEKELFEWIPAENKVCNVRTIINPLELDIYLPDYKLAIEYDGIFYHSEQFKPEGYHIFKTSECEKQGIQLLHIFDIDDIDIWKSIISGKLKKNTRIFARKCIVKELSFDETKIFLEENHLQGFCPSKYRYGLFYNGELVQVMTFGVSRFNKRYDFELLRLASKKFTSVVGGASKLLKFFRDSHTGSIISYSNLRFSSGDVYRKLGFTQLGRTNVNYFYAGHNKILTRNQCQKHRLKDLLESFDQSKTESENMRLNGYFKVFDCGNLIFTLD